LPIAKNCVRPPLDDNLNALDNLNARCLKLLGLCTLTAEKVNINAMRCKTFVYIGTEDSYHSIFKIIFQIVYAFDENNIYSKISTKSKQPNYENKPQAKINDQSVRILVGIRHLTF